MKTEFRVHIYRHGSNNDAILTMIGNHNAGKVNINLDILAAYIDARVAQYPVTDKDRFVYTHSKNLDTLDISEDGYKTFTLQIKEITVVPLENDLEENPIYNIHKNGQ